MRRFIGAGAVAFAAVCLVPSFALAHEAPSSDTVAASSSDTVAASSNVPSDEAVAASSDAPVADATFLDDSWRVTSQRTRRDLYRGHLANAGPQFGQGKTVAAPEVGTFEVDEKGVTPAGRVLGVGLQLGLPSGVTVKYMFAPNLGIVGGLGVGVGWYIGPALSVNLDIVFHPHVLVRADYLTVSWYVGAGGWVSIAENNARPFFYFAEYARYFGPRFWFAARGVLGVNVALNDLPIEFFVEGNPALVVFPGISFGMGFTIGLRFYF